MIYLFQNESRKLIEEKINEIIKEDTNIITCDFLIDGIDYILEEASYLSLFDEKKYLIIRNANCFSMGKINETESKKIEAYLNNPNPNSIVIFITTEKIDERKKITKLVKSKYELKVLPKLTPKDLITRIISIFKENKMNIQYESARYISEKCLNNFDLISNEIIKILTCYNGESKEVIHEDVKNLVSKNIEENIFKFSDAIVKKDTAKMFSIFNDLKLLKEEPVILINAIAREYRLMFKVKILLKNRKLKNAISQTLGLQDWLVEKVIQNSYNYEEKELKEKIVELSRLDIAIKSGQIDKYLGIELFMLDI